jgi:ribosomal protein S27AE
MRVSPTRECPACGRATAPHQDIRIRGEAAELYRCGACGLFHFPEPSWLDAVYAEPISDLDIGLATRCINHARIIEAVLRSEKLHRRSHLDYGGGYGLLTRLLRDRGIDMRHYEPYTQNLFAAGFEGDVSAAYGSVTAVEVFEHLTHPDDVMRSLSPDVPLVIVSTVLVPDGMTDLSDWWYVGGPTGQHITFYTVPALTAVARRHGYRLTSNGVNIHLLHRKPLHPLTRAILKDVRSTVLLARLLRLFRRSPDLRESDGEEALARYLVKTGQPGGTS